MHAHVSAQVKSGISGVQVLSLCAQVKIGVSGVKGLLLDGVGIRPLFGP